MNVLYMRHIENGYWIALYASYNLCIMFHLNSKLSNRTERPKIPKYIYITPPHK
jgi:hypothetical protein